jgi:hypothetical protein
MSPSSTDSTINWGTSENGGFHLERWIDMNGDLICLRARFLECFGDHGQNQSPMMSRSGFYYLNLKLKRTWVSENRV